MSCSDKIKSKARSHKNLNGNKHKSHKSHKSHNLYGGFTTSLKQKQKSNNVLLKGGSPASELVMRDLLSPAVQNDYVTSPRIRENANVYNDLSFLKKQTGGSPASDLVMSQLTSSPCTQQYPNEQQVKGDMNSLNLYKTTGGAKKYKKNKNNNNTHSKNSKEYSKNSKNSKKSKEYSKKSKKSKKNNSNSSNRKYKRGNTQSQRGGASDWMNSQYSLGPINNPESGVGLFSQSGAPSYNTLMNPPTMGLAGSGFAMNELEGGNVNRAGAPY